MGKWKEGEMEREEAARVLFTNMIMQVALFLLVRLDLKQRRVRWKMLSLLNRGNSSIHVLANSWQVLTYIEILMVFLLL